MGGGAASSAVQGQAGHKAFDAVQRGDAEMGQKLHRVVRACIELDDNPILSIHDQGAGGNGNVLKEIVDPLGATFDVSRFILGDPTLSTLELWGAEYQENDALLMSADKRALLERICAREKLPVSFVGEVADHGRVVLMDSSVPTAAPAVDLPLKTVLGDVPVKTFESRRVPVHLSALVLPNTNFRAALERVFKLVSVGSKRFLTNKVDRSVTGLVAQQQCVGPFHTPLADVAVAALSPFSTVGIATAVGEQPVKSFPLPEKWVIL